MQKANPKKKLRTPQRQSLPGKESEMNPKPVSEKRIPGKKLEGKKALITGGDSGIGKATAILFAQEGADIAIVYLNEHDDAAETQRIIMEEHGRDCILIATDISKEKNCTKLIEKIAKKWGKIDILVNNAATQFESKKLQDITTEHLVKTFATNIFSFFWITKAALEYMKKGSCIINSASVTAYRGSPELIDYSSTKGAIVAFTRSLSSSLVSQGIRVNGVAPGPIWTPLIPASFSSKKTAKHGSDVPMKRAGQPVEVASCYLFLACDDSSYMSGQFLHPNGGEIVNA